MKAIVLAAGYATRLYPLTLDTPKPLLEVGGRPILGRLLEQLAAVESLDHVYVVTNAKFAERFREFASAWEGPFELSVVDDGTTSDEDKLGAIGDLGLVIEHERLDDDLLVAAGDSVFSEGGLGGLVRLGQEKQAVATAVYDVGSVEAVKRYSAITADEGGRVVAFEPNPAAAGRRHLLFAAEGDERPGEIDKPDVVERALLVLKRQHLVDEGGHLLEPSQRGGVDLEREKGYRRVAAREAAAGAGQAAQDLILGVPEGNGIATRNAKLHEDAQRASADHGTDAGIDHRPIIHTARRAPRAAQGDHGGDRPRPPHPFATFIRCCARRQPSFSQAQERRATKSISIRARRAGAAWPPG